MLSYSYCNNPFGDNKMYLGKKTIMLKISLKVAYIATVNNGHRSIFTSDISTRRVLTYSKIS